MSFLLLWIICDFLGGQLITAIDVKCPKPAENCLTGTYNLHVIPGLGCIGCQEGCKPGFMQTSNQKYYNNSPVLTGSKDYNGIQIQASVNIEEPEWICTPGDKCLPGYFQGGSPSSSNHCAWCGEGCSRCTNYDMCDSCFGGYRRVSTPTILGTVRSTCQHSNVLCPVQPPNCTYDVYAVSGAGCLGCQLCSPGFTVTFNPSYFSTKSSASSSYDYRGLQIRSTVDINEPRYTCVAGKACSDGFYSRAAGDLTVCEWCGDGCVSCTDRNACKTCKKGYILSKTNGTCQTTNPIDESVMITPYSSSDEESTPPDSPLESLVFQHDFSQLPERYYRRLVTNGVMNGLVNVPETTESRESREKDLRAAFDWVKQQLAIMKEQDKSLLKQFISLRTTILQLRCLHEIYSSQSDISSIDGSTCSLNSPRVRHRYHRTPDRNHIHFMELSLKTKSLLFLPEPNTVKTLKWKSDEIL